VKLHSAIVDDALTDFDRARRWADAATFGDVLSPVDGVTYPGICADVPLLIREQMIDIASIATGEPLTCNFSFARLSLAGVAVPHQAHNDATMGRYSMMLYLNRPEHCVGGTEIVRHVVHGMDHGPQNDCELAAWELDHSQPEQWEVAGGAKMRANRAFVFDAALMHRAAPIGGFGSTQFDGRLVLTGFYS